MGTINDTFGSVWRDYETDGVPASGEHEPVKSAIRAIGPIIETAISTAGFAGLFDVAYATRAELEGDLAWPAESVALVYADATDANNDLYLKTGAAGAGAWTLQTTLHDIIENLASGILATAEGFADSAEASAITAAATVLNTVASDILNVENLFPGGPQFDMTPPRTTPAANPSDTFLPLATQPTIETVNGRRVATFTNMQPYVSFAADDLPDPFYVGMTLEEYTKTLSQTRVYVQGFTSAGVATGAQTEVFNIAGFGVSSAVPQRYATSVAKVGGATTYRVYFQNTGDPTNVMRISNPTVGARSGAIRIRPNHIYPVFNVDGTNGNDANPGTADAPFKTFDRGLRACTQPNRNIVGEIVMRAGDYPRPHIPLANSNSKGQNYVRHLVVRAPATELVRFIAGDALTGISKTAGLVNTYQADFATAPHATKKYLHEHGVPESAIADADRHGAHRGLAYRNPFSTRLRRAASLAEVDATPATWYYTGGKYYFHLAGSADPTAGPGIEIRVPDNPSPSGTLESGVEYGLDGKSGHFECHNIVFMYYYRGMRLLRLSWYFLHNVTTVGCGEAGIVNSFSNGLEVNCRSLANGTDGFQGFGSTGAVTSAYVDQVFTRINAYSALNGDDGISDHDRCNVSLGGYIVSEYNDDGGISPSTGADYQNGGEVIVSHNGQGRNKTENSGLSAPTGGGIDMRAGPGVNEGGVSTSFTGGRVIARGNAFNFRSAIAGDVLRGVGYVSLDPWDLSLAGGAGAAGVHFYQRAPAILDIVGAKYSGAGTVKDGAPTVTPLTDVPA